MVYLMTHKEIDYTSLILWGLMTQTCSTKDGSLSRSNYESNQRVDLTR